MQHCQHETGRSNVTSTSGTQAADLHPAALDGGQHKLAVVAGVTMLCCLATFLASQWGLMPTGAATAVVLVGIGVVLRIAWRIAGRTAGSTERTRFALMVSNVALGVAALSALAALPRLTRQAGPGLFALDLTAQLWLLGIVFAAAAPVRTLNWRALAGAFLAGFLGLMGLARLLGRPVIVALGNDNLFAAAVWVPLTEEISKLVPLAFVLPLALRRRDVRPAALDVVLLSACAAAGFAVSENASFGRGGFSLGAALPVSLLSPAATRGEAYGWSVVQTGHVLHTALIAVALALAAFYPKRLPRWVTHAWQVPVMAIAAVLLEHCSQNAIVTGHLNPYVGKACIVLSLGGRLCALLLALGLCYAALIEWRGFAPLAPSKLWLLLSREEATRRGARLASLQQELRS